MEVTVHSSAEVGILCESDFNIAHSAVLLAFI
jgi:hypothetical protein